MHLNRRHLVAPLRVRFRTLGIEAPEAATVQETYQNLKPDLPSLPKARYC